MPIANVLLWSASLHRNRFVESELELHGQIKEVHAIATTPEHYVEVIRLGGLKTVINLLNHENEDIVAAAIDLLQEMTDADTLDAEEEYATALIEGLLDGQLLPVLMEAFGRLKDTPENDGLQAALGIFENMLDLNPKLSERMVKECDLLTWLVTRVRTKKFDPIKVGDYPHAIVLASVHRTVHTDQYLHRVCIARPPPSALRIRDLGDSLARR
jgi:beta-catenin-like protein 1